MSTNVGVSSCCLSGKVQNGTPVGRVEEIGGIKTYISEPADKSKVRTIVFITDIFGWELPNVRLLADNYAKAGFYTYIPDLLDGDGLPIEFLQDVEPPLSVRENLGVLEKGAKTARVGATLGPWLLKHREAVVQPKIGEFVSSVRAIPGTGKVGAIGFCWGGRYVILAAGDAAAPGGAVDAAYACHPSLVSIPADFDQVTRPLSLALGEKDSLLGEKEVGQVKEILGGKKDAVQSEIRIYEDQVHGFALRGDWDSDKDKKAMDAAEKQGIEWFNKWLA